VHLFATLLVGVQLIPHDSRTSQTSLESVEILK